MLLTGILGQGDDLSEELGEVRQILAEKASFDNNSLPGVRGSQLATKKLRLASNAKTRSSLGVLHRASKLAQVVYFHSMLSSLTLNANSARPTERPGRGW